MALANVQMHLESAFHKFFREPSAGFPRFKSKKSSRKSYTTNVVNGNIFLEGKYLKLPKMTAVRIKLHRPVSVNKKKMEKKKYPLRLCKGFISLMGWITHSDTYEWYLMYIKPLISVRAVKRIISKMDKEANKNARMENRELLLTA